MNCEGYNREAHEAERLHAKGLCSSCYQKKWRAEHKQVVVKYQKDYRAGPEYQELNRLYVKKYREED